MTDVEIRTAFLAVAAGAFICLLAIVWPAADGDE